MDGVFRTVRARAREAQHRPKEAQTSAVSFRSHPCAAAISERQRSEFLGSPMGENCGAKCTHRTRARERGQDGRQTLRNSTRACEHPSHDPRDHQAAHPHGEHRSADPGRASLDACEAALRRQQHQRERVRLGLVAHARAAQEKPPALGAGCTAVLLIKPQMYRPTMPALNLRKPEIANRANRPALLSKAMVQGPLATYQNLNFL